MFKQQSVNKEGHVQVCNLLSRHTLLIRKIFLHSFLDLLYKLIVANIAITAYKPENKKQKKNKYSLTKVTHIHRKDLYKFQHLHEKISKACKLPGAFFITGPQ